jgi:hypothetical protein
MQNQNSEQEFLIYKQQKAYAQSLRRPPKYVKAPTLTPELIAFQTNYKKNITKTIVKRHNVKKLATRNNLLKIHTQAIAMQTQMAKQEIQEFKLLQARKLFEAGEAKEIIAKELSLNITDIKQKMQQDAKQSNPWQELNKTLKHTPKQRRQEMEYIPPGKNSLAPMPADNQEHLEQALNSQNIVCHELTIALRQTIQSYKEGRILPSHTQNEADILTSITTAAKNVIAITRDVAGLKVGQPNELQSKQRQNIRMFKIVSRPKEVATSE